MRLHSSRTLAVSEHGVMARWPRQTRLMRAKCQARRIAVHDLRIGDVLLGVCLVAPVNQQAAKDRCVLPQVKGFPTCARNRARHLTLRGPHVKRQASSLFSHPAQIKSTPAHVAPGSRSRVCPPRLSVLRTLPELLRQLFTSLAPPPLLHRQLFSLRTCILPPTR